MRKSRKQKRDEMARQMPSSRDQPVTNKAGDVFGPDKATWMQSSDRLISRPEIPLRVPLTGEAVAPRTTLTHSHSNVCVLPAEDGGRFHLRNGAKSILAGPLLLNGVVLGVR